MRYRSADCGRISRPSLLSGNGKRTADAANFTDGEAPGNNNHINE
jgi:hypothetical protein